MILSHYNAGTGAILVETREEGRLLQTILQELPASATVCTMAAPSGSLKDVRTGKQAADGAGMLAAYQWASSGPGRVLVVYDWHVLVNNAGHWRILIDNLPYLRSPRGAGEGDPPSLVVFVGPCWELQHTNPLKGAIPSVEFHPPDRTSLRSIADKLSPLGKNGDAIVDALCGLAADSAEQAAAECLAARGKWDAGYLRSARHKLIREAGLEIWPATSELGGLSGLRDWAESEMLPWVRDEQLAVRRMLCAGIPGVGKSFAARWFAYRLGCECCRLSIPSLKAGTVGSSEANLRRALRVLDTLGADAPIVCVIDEIDTIARDGLDAGTSSGMFAELLTWLQESTAQCVVIATLNRLDKLDAALESRFSARFFFDLPSRSERQVVAKIHYTRLGCASELVSQASDATAEYTEGFSSRELAEQICPSVARRTKRLPSEDAIREVCSACTPASRTQAAQLKAMRDAAGSLRRANDPSETHTPKKRQIGRKLEPAEAA